MTVGEQLLAEIKEGYILRFCDYGSGVKRVVYAETGRFNDRNQFVPKHGYSSQIVYRLRNAGKIKVVSTDASHDYYGLA